MYALTDRDDVEARDLEVSVERGDDRDVFELTRHDFLVVPPES